jgi:hypothetical protein
MFDTIGDYLFRDECVMGSRSGGIVPRINVQNVQDGLRRSRTNAILRDKMSNLSPNEVQAALRDLERREKQQ